ncbi:MAG: hypothetical protein LC753_00955 [Acidobacteria bacterium]|nr:hypothetical protein [Acidobacteriota bacterium]MCA1648883.1 hypothetical protein [Acidobacteriota bacterium]
MAIRGIVLAVAVIMALPGWTTAQMRSSDAQRRRDQIRMMEGVLTEAVRLGAEQLGREMQASSPNLVMLTGSARARGFVLDGYGVFFDVEIPALRPSVVWSMRTMERDLALGSALQSLKQHLASLPESSNRMQLEQAFRRLALQVGPVPTPPNAQGRQGLVSSANAMPPAAPDPDKEYTESVKEALIDAMLDHSLPMNLGPDEWLTVAARDGFGPLVQGEIYDASTIVIRVRGSALAAYAADRTKRDEVRRSVEVRVF